MRRITIATLLAIILISGKCTSDCPEPTNTEPRAYRYRVEVYNNGTKMQDFKCYYYNQETKLFGSVTNYKFYNKTIGCYWNKQNCRWELCKDPQSFKQVPIVNCKITHI